MDSGAPSQLVIAPMPSKDQPLHPASPAPEARLFGTGILSCFYWEEVGVS